MTENADTPASRGLQPDVLAERLGPLVAAECGPGARVARLGLMEDGHAGLTFGFDVVGADGAAIGSYVLKLAPIGVTRRGNTDVYRQAPLLRGLKAAGLPVPEVPWASPDEDLLGTPFIVMEKLPGRVFLVWEAHESFSRAPEAVRDIWLQTARLLAQLHRVDWRKALPDWEQPRPLKEELDRWAGVLKHAQDPDWLAAGKELAGMLGETFPDERPIGVIHGDFQPGNILFENGRAAGLIDWELSSIGAQGLDVGWILMMSDKSAWDASWPPITAVTGADLVNAYRDAGGPAYLNLEWYQALAQYRLGSIACLNVKLHRTGKRVDPLWERFAPSIGTLFARGIDLVKSAKR